MKSMKENIILKIYYNSPAHTIYQKSLSHINVINLWKIIHTIYLINVTYMYVTWSICNICCGLFEPHMNLESHETIDVKMIKSRSSDTWQQIKKVKLFVQKKYRKQYKMVKYHTWSSTGHESCYFSYVSELITWVILFQHIWNWQYNGNHRFTYCLMLSIDNSALYIYIYIYIHIHG